MVKISKTDEQKRAEARIMRDFGGNVHDPAHREAAEATRRLVAEQIQEMLKQKC